MSEKPDTSLNDEAQGRSVSRREFLKLAGMAGAAIGLGAGLGGLVAACGDDEPTETTTTAAAGSTTTVAAGMEKLKVGMILDYSFPLHVMWQHIMEAYVPHMNSTGGIKVGDQAYEVDLIMYDGKRDSETSRSAVQRLLNEDKVEFILGDESTDYWQPLTEQAGKLVIAGSPSPEILKPINKLTFQATYLNTKPAQIWGWCSERWPDVKKVMGGHPDNLQGNEESRKLEMLCKAWGQEVVKEILYPMGTTDFSAIATTLVASGGEVFSTCGGGDVSDGQFFKAMKQAGFEGPKWITVGFVPGSATKVVPIENHENVASSWALFELPKPPAAAKELYDVYVAKFGEWDYPAIFHSQTLWLLKAALEKAATLDATKLAEVMHAGFEFDSPDGHGKIIPRPDLDNPQCVDCIYAVTMGVVEKGEWKVIEELSLDRAFEYNKKTYGWA